jgi:DNA repair protein RecO (recombination protein O)
MLQKTRGLVIRSVKYGETSLVVTMFTELFGLQSYMVSGVRKESLKAGMRASQFQPATLLEMVVYHHERHKLQRIKECQWAVLYQQIFSDIRKNAVALFMVELLQKCLKQPDPQPELFHFMEDVLQGLDQASPMVAANIPIYFALHLSHFFGFRMQDTYDEENMMLDLREGIFVNEPPAHQYWTGNQVSFTVSQFLKALQPDELEQIPMNRDGRRLMLDTCLQYYALHVSDFGTLRSLPVLQEVLE